MKTHIKNLFLLPVVISGLALLLAGRVTAQTFTTLHTFTGSEGVGPGFIILSSNTLYGTTILGPDGSVGSVFALNTDGTSFTTLHSFTRSGSNINTNSDGADPFAILVLGNTLYGTAGFGGAFLCGQPLISSGTLFALNTDGTGFTVVHDFSCDAAFPSGILISGDMLYGTTEVGGTLGGGTVFKVNSDGTGFTNLLSFNGGSNGNSPEGLTLSGTNLYGTASGGGSTDHGTVFKLNMDGSGFTNLHSITQSSTNSSGVYTNSDGIAPNGSLILSGNTLYGTASGGGSSGNGTVFKVNIDGTDFTTLHSFAATSGASSISDNGTNSDGASPVGPLILSGNTLYGTATSGGSSGNGTVFALNTDGSGFVTIHNFSLFSTNSSGDWTNSDGAYPQAGLILSGNTLYGTAWAGGSAGNGTVFSLSFPPQLNIIPSGANGILTWPTNYLGFDYTGFALQSTTNLGSPAVWTPVSADPVVIGGQKVVVNPISGTKQFFRLSQ
jgi:uncharacterized repeat protein (TIGR03803 family)